MRIDGKILADELLAHLQSEILSLKQTGITPALAIILVGDDPASASYVRQKQKAADTIGADIKLFRFPSTIDISSVNETIRQCNNDPSIHGIIIQLPLPSRFSMVTRESVRPENDVDGFVPESKFQAPVAMAVEKILMKIFNVQFPISKQTKKFSNYKQWIQAQKIVVIGRGETAGKPIAHYCKKQGCSVAVIHSQTPQDEKRTSLKGADVIISCVGKERVVKKEDIKNGAMLISVGISRDASGKLHGDYEEKDIESVASFYTPTPGGVGPVNVACLMENLVESARKHPN